MPDPLDRWLDRHRQPDSLGLHLIGIPLTVFGVGQFFEGRPVLATVLFVLGYALQFWGHGLERNDVGELIPFKRLLGMRVTAVAPFRRRFG